MPFEDRAVRRLIIFFWLIAIALFAVEAWKSRFAMTWDGVQYLDDADEYFNRHWASAVNSQWSPMYVWMAGALLHVLHPSPYWEFPVVHLANFCIALFSLVTFQCFLNSVLGSVRDRLGLIPPWTIVVIGFTAFLYATLDFTSLAVVTPDLLMHAFVYLVAGLILRIAAGERRISVFAALGVALGLGYLAKAPFFFYSFVAFAILLLILGLKRSTILRLSAAAAPFVLIAGPYIALLSHYKHRLTYGDSGRYNVIWMLNGVPYYHWHGNPPGSGTPLHPTLQISIDPPAYEFATPIGGTYPPWFDPIYWNEGAKPHYKLTEIAGAAARAAKYYEYLVHRRQLALVAGLLILIFATPRKELLARRLIDNGPLLLFGLFPFAMYALVHQDSRFLSSFFVLVWVGLYLAAFESMPAILSSTARSVAIVVGALMLVESAIVAGSIEPRDMMIAGNSPHPYWDLAHDLSTIGLQPGDPVAIVGNHLPYFWARLAHVHIVSEVLLNEPACGGRACTDQVTAQWQNVKGALAATGAKLIVAPCIHGLVDQPGWQQLGNTGVFAYKF